MAVLYCSNSNPILHHQTPDPVCLLITMGLLKHVVLPAFALIHAGSLVACRDLASWARMVGLKDDVTEADEKSIRQNHMLGCLRGFNFAMLLLCGMGIFTESAHFRKEIAVAEAALFSVVTVDAYRLGGLNYMIPGSQALVAMIGVFINSMEPGIFTKDKKASA